jgi:hypothetical protein
MWLQIKHGETTALRVGKGVADFSLAVKRDGREGGPPTYDLLLKDQEASQDMQILVASDHPIAWDNMSQTDWRKG